MSFNIKTRFNISYIIREPFTSTIIPHLWGAFGQIGDHICILHFYRMYTLLFENVLFFNQEILVLWLPSMCHHAWVVHCNYWWRKSSDGNSYYRLGPGDANAITILQVLTIDNSSGPSNRSYLSETCSENMVLVPGRSWQNHVCDPRN